MLGLKLSDNNLLIFGRFQIKNLSQKAEYKINLDYFFLPEFYDLRCYYLREDNSNFQIVL